MVKNRHSGIREVGYAPPAPEVGGIEVLSLAELDRRLATSPGLEAPQRTDFHQLFAVENGTLRHMVDFAEHTVEPGDWLWLRPRQVQQFHDWSGVSARLVFFQPSSVDPSTAEQTRLDDPFASTHRYLSHEDADAARGTLDHLADAFGSPPHVAPHVQPLILRHLLAVLLLQLTHPATPVGSPAPEAGEAFLRFRSAVENHFTQSRHVNDYARMLGYSPRTLTRATTAATGTSAKEYIDSRLVLEAKRLLAHNDDPVERIASTLGFDDVSNFVKYFAHRTGATPAAFRRHYRYTGR